ncbi:DUF2158 domain-containing protein [Ochrobactrum vermis]|uniref:DUF2158 domain-containing protein n=1 Tax=Ochrobactrum vermis TaxID=1827297 RepID=A0ABU8PGT5_9HYPH|nr:DUF2158 domain-containing protein [Ochrobactrum vermis]PQZ30932.1 DUF2158 domain-containing protein [Ochrobactrum vermis]
MSDEIKVGSVVQLKSGGPRMTVNGIDHAMGEDDRLSAWCDWFVEERGSLQQKNGVFPLTSLEPA